MRTEMNIFIGEYERMKKLEEYNKGQFSETVMINNINYYSYNFKDISKFLDDKKFDYNNPYVYFSDNYSIQNNNTRNYYKKESFNPNSTFIKLDLQQTFDKLIDTINKTDMSQYNIILKFEKADTLFAMFLTGLRNKFSDDETKNLYFNLLLKADISYESSTSLNLRIDSTNENDFKNIKKLNKKILKSFLLKLTKDTRCSCVYILRELTDYCNDENIKKIIYENCLSNYFDYYYKFKIEENTDEKIERNKFISYDKMCEIIRYIVTKPKSKIFRSDSIIIDEFLDYCKNHKIKIEDTQFLKDIYNLLLKTKYDSAILNLLKIFNDDVDFNLDNLIKDEFIKLCEKKDEEKLIRKLGLNKKINPYQEYINELTENLTTIKRFYSTIEFLDEKLLDGFYEKFSTEIVTALFNETPSLLLTELNFRFINYKSERTENLTRIVIKKFMERKNTKDFAKRFKILIDSNNDFCKQFKLLSLEELKKSGDTNLRKKIFKTIV